MYKMIVIDLDGTLLNSQKEINPKDADMINKAYEEKGVISVIATGRSYVCANYIGHLVGDNFAQYIISSNGSIVKDNVKNLYLRKKNISNENTLKIMKTLKKYNFKYIIDIESKVVANGRLVNQQNLGKIGQPYEIVEDLEKYFIDNAAESITITLIGNRQMLIEAKYELEKIEDLKTTEICESLDIRENEREIVTYIDVINKESSKKEAIILLAEYLGINKEEIIVIGDGGNDIPMFEIAGLKIAMENALDIVKKEADYITTNNNESGVAKAIQKFIFDRE